jgi:hypothetical protein
VVGGEGFGVRGRTGRIQSIKNEVKMRSNPMKDAGLVVVGLAVMLGQGCKQKPAPVVAQPVVLKTPRVARPEVPAYVPPMEDDAVTQAPRQPRHHVVARVDPTPVQPVVNNEAVAAAQRQRDATLLQQQQVASQRQQQELNGVVQRSVKITQDQQNEPRIQEAPQVPITQPDVSGPRIQDNPVPPQDNPPVQAEPVPEAPSPQF